MVPLSKSGVRKHRGFESHPLRQRSPADAPMPALPPPLPRSRTFESARSGARRRLGWTRPPGERLPRSSHACGSASRARSVSSALAERSPSGLWRRTGNAVRGNASRVRIPPSPPPHPADAPPRWALASSRRLKSARSGCSRPPWRTHPRGERARASRRVRAVSRVPRSFRSTSGVHVRRGRAVGREPGLVVAYAIRHAGACFLFDTGFGLGNAGARRALPAPSRGRSAEVLGEAGIDPDEITASPTATSTPTTPARTRASRASRSTSSRPSGAIAHEPATTRSSSGSTSRAPTTSRRAATTRSRPGSASSRRPATRPATSRSSSTQPRRAARCSPARRSTATASGVGSRGAREGASAAPATRPRTHARRPPPGARPEAGPLRPRPPALAGLTPPRRPGRAGILAGPC